MRMRKTPWPEQGYLLYLMYIAFTTQIAANAIVFRDQTTLTLGYKKYKTHLEWIH